MQANVYQRSQWKRETTHGTAVAADRIFPGLSVDFDPAIPEFFIDSQGYDAPTGVVYGKERSVGRVTAESADFNALILAFSSYFKYSAPTTPAAGILTRRWTFDPSSKAANAYASYSLEVGEEASTEGRKAAFVVFNTWELATDPTRPAAFNAALFGRSMAFPATLNNTGVTEVTQTVMGPRMADVYLATTEAGLGAGQIEPFSVTIRGAEKYGDVYTVKSSQDSFKDIVTRRHMITATIEIDASDAATAGYLADLRNAATRYLQIVYTGPAIETVAGPVTYYWKATLTMPFKFNDPGFGVQQDALSKRYTLTAIHEPTFNTTGGKFLAVVDSTLAAL